MFNKINGDFNDVAIRAFKVGLLVEHGLRKSLTGKPANSVRQLIDRCYPWMIGVLNLC